MAKFKRVSADEAQSKRKEFLKDTASGMAILKGFKAPPSWDKENRSARFIMTSEAADRYADIVVQAGLEIENFLKNPTALMFHNSRNWPIGNWSDVTKILSGRPKRTEGNLNFLPDGVDEDADRAARHVSAGSIRTVSIGFIPNWDEVDFILDDDEDWTGGFRFNKSELIECSLVPIPANPQALVKDASGDFKLARDMIEDILDTYAKTPEGLLIPMDEYRAKHMDLVGNRTSIVVDKNLMPAVRSFVPKDDRKLSAATKEEAVSFVGASVIFDPSDSRNKDGLAAEWANDIGEVIASYVVEDGEKKGVHALFVEFINERGLSGMMRGVEADRFLLVKEAEPDDNDDTMEDEEDDAGSANSTDTEAMDDEDAGCKPKSVVNGLSVSVEVDTAAASNSVKELSAEIEEVGIKAESLISKLKSLFGFSDIKDAPRIEPELATIPEPDATTEKMVISPEEAEAIKGAARKQLASLVVKGRI